MQFEDFDKRIKEAADHHHPAYNEKAWEKMEKLLNKHLPQEKEDRRRFLFWLLPALLVGAGAWLLISKPWLSDKTTANTQVVTGIKEENGSNAATSSTTAIATDTVVAGAQAMSGDEQNTTRKTQTTVTPAEKESEKEKPGSISGQLIFPGKEQDLLIESRPAKTARKKKYPAAATKNEMAKTNLQQNATVRNDESLLQPEAKQSAGEKIKAEETKAENVNPAVPVVAATEKEPQASAKTENKSTDTIKNAAPLLQKEKKRKTNSFFVSLSAGPDVSMAGTDRLGSLKLLTGAGIGYTIKDRLTVRTGFYTARKVYTASPTEYNPPPPFWTYYPYMEKIEADCKVYEIPLLFSYHFGKSTRRNWFATAGVSSLLMKKEVYDYYYKTTPTGPTRHRQWTLKNENEHYFSVITLSGGYQHQVSNKLSLLAEPYLKVPLSGVGYGNVKLNSAGLMISVAYKPFALSPGKHKKPTAINQTGIK